MSDAQAPQITHCHQQSGTHLRVSNAFTARSSTPAGWRCWAAAELLTAANASPPKVALQVPPLPLLLLKAEPAAVGAAVLVALSLLLDNELSDLVNDVPFEAPSSCCCCCCCCCCCALGEPGASKLATAASAAAVLLSCRLERCFFGLPLLAAPHWLPCVASLSGSVRGSPANAALLSQSAASTVNASVPSSSRTRSRCRTTCQHFQPTKC
jgi:hypothetical protein